MTLITTGRQIPAGSTPRSDVASDGTLWVALQNGSTVELWRIDGRGNPYRSGATVPGTLGAFRIDSGDNAHVVTVRSGRVWYYRGTATSGGTSWTMTSGVAVSNSGAANPDLVVHREGTGWVAHVVYSRIRSYVTAVYEYEWLKWYLHDHNAAYHMGELSEGEYTGSAWHEVRMWSRSQTSPPNWPYSVQRTHSHDYDWPTDGVADTTHTHRLVHSNRGGYPADGALTGNTRQVSGGTSYYSEVEYVRVRVTNGVVSGGTPERISPTYSSTRRTSPRIALRHTGDEKTVTTPDVYAAWSATRTGTGYGIRGRRAAYVGGGWSWQTEIALDEGHYLPSDDYWLNVAFDGSAYIVGGLWYDNRYSHLVLLERNVGDTATVNLETSENLPGSGDGRRFLRGQLTYDGQRNIWIVSARSGEPYSNSSPAVYNVWRRADSTIEPEVPVSRHSLGYNVSQVLVRPGHVGAAIDWVYAFSSPSPYEVHHGRFELVPKPLKTKVSGDFVGGEIKHRAGGTFVGGDIHSKRAGAFS